MIEEVYVSFDIAKLLKEKGFNIPCYGRYSVRSQEFHLDTTRPCNNGGISQYSAPTHQMTMAWLREVHHIAINIGWGEIFEDQYKWWCIVLNMDNGNILHEIDHHASYEEAVETALKYTLENLI